MSKYDALWAYIQGRNEETLVLSFADIAQIAGTPLEQRPDQRGMEKICSNNIWTQKAIAVCSLIHSLSCAENSIFNIASQQHKKKRSLTK